MEDALPQERELELEHDGTLGVGVSSTLGVGVGSTPALVVGSKPALGNTVGGGVGNKVFGTKACNRTAGITERIFCDSNLGTGLLEIVNKISRFANL